MQQRPKQKDQQEPQHIMHQHNLHLSNNEVDWATPNNEPQLQSQKDSPVACRRRSSLLTLESHSHPFIPVHANTPNEFARHNEAWQDCNGVPTPYAQRLTRRPFRVTTNLNKFTKARSYSPLTTTTTTKSSETNDSIACTDDKINAKTDSNKFVSVHNLSDAVKVQRSALPVRQNTSLQRKECANTSLPSKFNYLTRPPTVARQSALATDKCKKSIKPVKTIPSIVLESLTRTRSMPVSLPSHEPSSLEVSPSSSESVLMPLPNVHEPKQHSSIKSNINMIYNNKTEEHHQYNCNNDSNNEESTHVCQATQQKRQTGHATKKNLFVVATMEKSGSVFDEMARQLVASGKWTHVTVVPRAFSKTLYVVEHKANLSDVNIHLFLGDKSSCELVISSRRAILRHCTPAFTSLSRSPSRASLYSKQQIKLEVKDKGNHDTNTNNFMSNSNESNCNNKTRQRRQQQEGSASSIRSGVKLPLASYCRLASSNSKYSENLPYAQALGLRRGQRVPMGIASDGRVRMVDFIESSRCITLKSRMVATLLEYHKGNWNILRKYTPLTFYILPRQPFKDERDKLWSLVEGDYKSSNSSRVLNAAESVSLWIAKSSAGCHGTNVQIFDGDVNGIRKMLHFIDEQSNGYSWVVQQYIDRPLLYHKRKFDIRCWVLLILDGYKFYIHDELVMRTSSLPYNRDSATANSHDARLTHITNHCIQSESTTYSLYEKGNELWKEHLDGLIQYKAKKLHKQLFNKNEGNVSDSKNCREKEIVTISKWPHLQKLKNLHKYEDCTSRAHQNETSRREYQEGKDCESKTMEKVNMCNKSRSSINNNINNNLQGSLETIITPQIHHIVRESMLALRQHVPSESESRHTYCFQLFGYDFLIDDKLKVWLLEINGAPAAAERLLPQIVKDMIELTVLPYYPETYCAIGNNHGDGEGSDDCNTSSNSLTASSLSSSNKIADHKKKKNGFIPLYPTDLDIENKPFCY